jgi:hypothetical protein
MRRWSRCGRAAPASQAQPTTSACSPPNTIVGIYQSATNGIPAVLVGIVSPSLLVGGIATRTSPPMVVTERTRRSACARRWRQAVGHHVA